MSAKRLFWKDENNNKKYIDDITRKVMFCLQLLIFHNLAYSCVLFAIRWREQTKISFDREVDYEKV
jgi:hypothetical protein